MKKINVRLAAALGILVAIHIILSRFCSINTWNLKIGFAFVPVFAAAYLFGPAPAAIVGGLGDFLGAILFPIGPYFPGFTLNCALTGVIFGLLLHSRPTLPRVAAATVLNQFVLSLFGTTLWISILNGAPYWPLLVSRIPQTAILSVLEVTVMLALSRAFRPLCQWAQAGGRQLP